MKNQKLTLVFTFFALIISSCRNSGPCKEERKINGKAVVIANSVETGDNQDGSKYKTAFRMIDAKCDYIDYTDIAFKQNDTIWVQWGAISGQF